MKLIFEGYSDDTFGELNTDVEYDNCASGEPIEIAVTSGSHTLIVTGQYCPREYTGWAISVGTARCDTYLVGFPNWPMRLSGGGRDYSARLEIDAPDDAIVELVTGQGAVEE